MRMERGGTDAEAAMRIRARARTHTRTRTHAHTRAHTHAHTSAHEAAAAMPIRGRSPEAPATRLLPACCERTRLLRAGGDTGAEGEATRCAEAHKRRPMHTTLKAIPLLYARYNPKQRRRRSDARRRP